MLSAANRLKNGADFKKVFGKGKISDGYLIRIKFFKNNLREPRFGFIVSKKFAAKAAERNLIKRRLRAAAAGLLKNAGGFDIVVWPKGVVKKSAYRAIVADLKTILIKNDIISVQ